MKVVMVSRALMVGAYQRKLEELAREPDIELTAIVPPTWREGRQQMKLDRAHTEGYRLIVAPVAFNGQFHLHFYPQLGRLLRETRPDVLHMDEEPYNLATWLALRTGKQLGARCLFFTWQNLLRRYPWPFRGFETANYCMAQYAIAGNRAAAAVLHSKGYRGRLAVIPQFGVDPSVFAPAAGSTGRAESDFTIGYAGRLVTEKGIETLLRACAALPFPSWTLHLLGAGAERPRFEMLANQLGLSDRTHFLGSLPSTRITDFYRTLDVLVLPSISRPNWIEQFGRVLIEAMACGVPVIGSNSGEIPNVIGDAGLVFPEGEAEALAAHLTDLAQAPGRRAELAAAGRARVMAHYTQAQVAAETARVYREMVEKGAAL